MKKLNDYLIIAILVFLLLYSSFFLFKWHSKINSLEDFVLVKNIEIKMLFARSDSLKTVNLHIKQELFQCQNDKFIESSKRQKYENQLQNFEEECEHEKNALLFDSRINNSTDNELGLLLSRLGQSNSLSDAERILLPEQGNKKIYKSDIGGNTSEKKTFERREKNKNP